MNEQIDIKKDVTPFAERETVKHDRLTIVFQVAHDHCCTVPVSIEQRICEILQTTEQAWVRELKIKTTPQHIDFGFLEDVGVSYFCLTNNTKPRELDDKTDIGDLIICYGDGLTADQEPGWVVAPGRFFFGKPEDAARLRVYSKGTPVTATLTAFPK